LLRQGEGDTATSVFAVSRFPAFFAPFPKLALGVAAALAALSLSPGQAQAACAPGTAAGTCRVTVGQLQYDVTTFTGSYNGNSSKFQTPANNGEMPWWTGTNTGTSNSLATAFATEVGDYFGGVNNAFGFTNGPYFAYRADSSFVDAVSKFIGIGNSTFDYVSGLTDFNVYAKAALYSSPAASVPGPLPLFGAGAAFGFSRQLRKRIQASRLAAGSGQPLA